MMEQRPNTLRAIDQRQERIIMEFLDKYLYSKLYPNYNIVTDKDLQLKGCDVEIPTSERPEYHDVKAQASKFYINKPTPTFAFEVLFDYKDTTYTGWFLRDDLLTDVYVLVWIHRATVNAAGYLNNAEDINELEVMFVDKWAVRKIVQSTIYLDALYDLAVKMRKQNTQKEYLNAAVSVVYTASLNERPVNVVVRKSALAEVAKLRLQVTKDTIKVL